MKRLGTSSYSLVYAEDVNIEEKIDKIAEECNLRFIEYWHDLYDAGIDVLLVNVGYFTIKEGYKNREEWIKIMTKKFYVLSKKYGMSKETLTNVLNYVWGLSFSVKADNHKEDMSYKELRYYAYGWKTFFYSKFTVFIVSIIIAFGPGALMLMSGMSSFPRIANPFLSWLIYVSFAYGFIIYGLYGTNKWLNAISLNLLFVMLGNLLEIFYCYISRFTDFEDIGFRQEILEDSCVGDIAYLFCQIIFILLYFLYFYYFREISFNETWKEANQNI